MRTRSPPRPQRRLNPTCHQWLHHARPLRTQGLRPSPAPRSAAGPPRSTAPTTSCAMTTLASGAWLRRSDYAASGQVVDSNRPAPARVHNCGMVAHATASNPASQPQASRPEDVRAVQSAHSHRLWFAILVDLGTKSLAPWVPAPKCERHRDRAPAVRSSRSRKGLRINHKQPKFMPADVTGWQRIIRTHMANIHNRECSPELRGPGPPCRLDGGTKQARHPRRFTRRATHLHLRIRV